MNRPLLKIISLLMCVTFCNAIRCNNGWVEAAEKCYRISTVAVKKSTTNSCETYASQVPEGLKDILGFPEKLWIKNETNNNLKAINLNDTLEDVSLGGKYYSLCETSLIPNATFQVHRNVMFYDGNWTIPSSKYILDQMNKIITNNSLDMVWIGIFFNVSSFWTDGLKLSDKQKKLLQISERSPVNGTCGVYSAERNVTFRNCSECHSGIEITTGNISYVKNRTCSLITPTTSTITASITTEENTPSSTFDQLTTDNENSPTVTTNTTTNPSMLCDCPCQKPHNKTEFIESIQDIKIKKKEASSYIRSKTSAPDERTSSRTIGAVAVVIMIIPFGLIVLSDLPILIQPFCAVIRHMKNFCSR